MEEEKVYCIQCLQYEEDVHALKLEVERLNNELLKYKREVLTIPDDEECLDLSDEQIFTTVDLYFNLDFFLRGVKGLAAFVYQYLLRNENGELLYLCVDPDKQIFQYRELASCNLGENISLDIQIQSDEKCRILLDRVLPFIIKSSAKIYKKEIDRIYREEKKEDEDSNSDYSDYDSELEDIVVDQIISENYKHNNTVDDEIDEILKCYTDIKNVKYKNKRLFVDELIKLYRKGIILRS
jgi:hypothetical protein